MSQDPGRENLQISERTKMLKPCSLEHSITLDRFRRNYLDKNQPVLLKGLVQNWKAMSRWNTDYFKEKAPNLEVEIREYATLESPILGKPYRKIKMLLKDYLQYWEELGTSARHCKRNLYLAEWNFSSHAPFLLEDFETPEFFSFDWINELPAHLRFGRRWIFVGHPGVHTPIHTDTFASSAWLAMIMGSKHVRLIEPIHSAKITKGMNLFDHNTLNELRASGVDVLDAIISKGDVLYIPGEWLHQVNNIDKNIMLTENFVDDIHFPAFEREYRACLYRPLAHLDAVSERYRAKVASKC